MTKLSKLFSREKGVWYAFVWNESDRLGFERYLDHDVVNNLFIREGGKLSVWYDENETKEIQRKIKNKFLNDEVLIEQILGDLAEEWGYIEGYLERDEKIQEVGELGNYYDHLVKWWAAMAILFRLDLPEELAGSALEHRQKAEKFSDKMVEVWDDFFNQNDWGEMMNLVTPEEAFSMSRLSAREMSEIKNRERGIMLFNGSVYPLQDIQVVLEKAGVELAEGAAGDVVEFSGSVAYKGKARGVVRVVLFKKDLSDFKEGEVFVAEMTSPDYVPAIKKASGLVTDEGGITCHAAIISRELKKPCVIGTKIATQVLKDGDEVEVDADKGVVKILT